MSETPFVASVLHPTDFSAAGDRAFDHALALALRVRSRLTLLHVGPEHAEEVEWHRFPAVRQTLSRWGLMEAGRPHAAVFEERAVRVKKIALRSRHPSRALLEYLDRHPADLVVVGTHRREGFPRWFHRSVAAPTARRTVTMVLFVPEDTAGFVLRRDGRLRLRRILVPVDHHPSPRSGIEAAAGAARILADEAVSITVLHAGPDAAMPVVYLSVDAAYTWHPVQRPGDAVEEILAVARETEADLIVMVTEGHEGVVDALRGSTTEQVLRRAPCPVLAVPAERVPGAAPGSR